MKQMVVMGTVASAIVLGSSTHGAEPGEAEKHFRVAHDAMVAGERAETLADHARANTEYKRAIDEYRRSYELEPISTTLFGLGQAYRALGQLETALHFYRQYLLQSTPKGRWRDVANQEIVELEDALARQRAVKVSPPRGEPASQAETPAPAGATATPPTRVGPPNRSPIAAAEPRLVAQSKVRNDEQYRLGRRLGLGLGVSGLGLVIAGSALAGVAQDSANAAYRSMYDYNADRRFQVLKPTSIALLVVGGVALVTGTIFYVRGRR